MEIDIHRDEMNGDFGVVISQVRHGKAQRVALWFSPDEFTEFVRRLVQETADPGIEPAVVN